MEAECNACRGYNLYLLSKNKKQCVLCGRGETGGHTNVTLTKERTKQAVAARAGDVARTIREAARAGTPLDKALAQMGLQAERVPPFSQIEAPPKPEPSPSAKPEEKKPDVPDLASIKSAVRELNPGDASDFVSTQTGGLVAVLESRDPGDPAGFAAAKTMFEKNYLQSKRMVMFDEWLHDRRRAAGIQEAVAPQAQT